MWLYAMLVAGLLLVLTLTGILPVPGWVIVGVALSPFILIAAIIAIVFAVVIVAVICMAVAR